MPPEAGADQLLRSPSARRLTAGNASTVAGQVQPRAPGGAGHGVPLGLVALADDLNLG
jgi:hypothetical protein